MFVIEFMTLEVIFGPKQHVMMIELKLVHKTSNCQRIIFVLALELTLTLKPFSAKKDLQNCFIEIIQHLFNYKSFVDNLYVCTSHFWLNQGPEGLPVRAKGGQSQPKTIS